MARAPPRPLQGRAVPPAPRRLPRGARSAEVHRNGRGGRRRPKGDGPGGWPGGERPPERRSLRSARAPRPGGNPEGSPHGAPVRARASPRAPSCSETGTRPERHRARGRRQPPHRPRPVPPADQPGPTGSNPSGRRRVGPRSQALRRPGRPGAWRGPGAATGGPAGAPCRARRARPGDRGGREPGPGACRPGGPGEGPAGGSPHPGRPATGRGREARVLRRRSGCLGWGTFRDAEALVRCARGGRTGGEGASRLAGR